MAFREADINLPPFPVGNFASGSLVDFLGAGKVYSRFASIEEIDAFVAGNRELWGD